MTRLRVNEWFNGTLFSRLNDKAAGSIVLIMQRLHEDDLTGHLLNQGGWEYLVLPAIAEQEELHQVRRLGRVHQVKRCVGEALQPGRETLDTLNALRQTIGEYNFAGQYQQAPVPREGGMVKRVWFRRYSPADLPKRFDTVLQSWDTANKATELSDFSVCTTWGLRDRSIYLLHVLRERMDYPTLKRAVRYQVQQHQAQIVLIEDKASGTQLIQELRREQVYGVRAYKPDAGMTKAMRMHAQTGMIENGYVHLPAQASWLDLYLHELTTFPASKYDDQVDSTAQALHWIAVGKRNDGILEFYRRRVAALSERTLEPMSE